MRPVQAVGTGVGYALIAGLLWGLVFVAPVLLPDYPPAMLAFGRYLAFGVIALPLALRDRTALARLTASDWKAAFALAAVGNIAYYLLLATAIQTAGVPLPTMVIGTLPVVIAVCSNLGGREIAWRRLAVPLALVGAGVACVNAAELHRPALGRTAPDLVLGLVLAGGALACWTWYPIHNARRLRRMSGIGPGAWATAQGLATLPLAAVGMLATLSWLAWRTAPAAAGASDAPGFALPLGPQPLRFVGMMLALGLFASWLGTLCWNRASQLLPMSLAGQMVVFETLAALLYGFVHRGAWPDAPIWIGIGLLLAGVACAARSVRLPGTEPAG